MSNLGQALEIQSIQIQGDGNGALSVAVSVQIYAVVLFDFDVSIEWIRSDDGARLATHNLRQTMDASWLPRGGYRAHLLKVRAGLPASSYTMRVSVWHAHAGQHQVLASQELAWHCRCDSEASEASWQLEAQTGTPALEHLSWRKGGGDWFFKHFDHAARTTMSYMLGDSPLLRGKILDVGCGDGITDLGIALRAQPELLIGIDPFKGYERLFEVCREAHLPLTELPSNLRFQAEDANHLPFADDSFDVVISWGSLEHIVGGYGQALREIKRVLKPDGLLFAHPGLFYSDIGHHLGEFKFAQDEAYVHLKHSRDDLQKMVLSSEPQRMDRSGHVATSAEYWQWFTELNPITTTRFEQELRALDFELWRVAVRTHDRVDYTAALQPYPIMDLAVAELYVSAYNRKPKRPNAFTTHAI